MKDIDQIKREKLQKALIKMKIQILTKKRAER